MGLAELRQGRNYYYSKYSNPKNNKNNYSRNNSDIAAGVVVTLLFLFTALSRITAVWRSSLLSSRIAFIFGLGSVVAMDKYQWPMKGICNIRTQCVGSIVTTVLANFSLSSNEKIVRILCIFVLGSFVSLSSPYSHYFTTTDVVGSFLPTMVVAMVLIIPLILVWERKSTIRKRIDFVTVYGLRIVLVAVFAHHLGKFFVLHYNWDSNDNDYNDDQNQLLLDENTKFQQTLFAMMEAAIVAATGFAATGSFRGE